MSDNSGSLVGRQWNPTSVFEIGDKLRVFGEIR